MNGTLVVACALAMPLTSGAQPPPQAPGTPLEPCTPVADAKDLKSVLFNWTRNMGMLKGSDERDMVATLEYQARSGLAEQTGRSVQRQRLLTQDPVEDREVLR